LSVSVFRRPLKNVSQKERQGCSNPAFFTLKRSYDFKAFYSSVEPSTRNEPGVARTFTPYKAMYFVCQVKKSTIYSNKIVIRFYSRAFFKYCSHSMGRSCFFALLHSLQAAATLFLMLLPPRAMGTIWSMVSSFGRVDRPQ
jgi:hypothetical protein